MPKALEGIKVLELTSVVLGPYACQLLGDLGADIIKVEPPSGDTNRYLGAYKQTPSMSALFMSCNRNKRSIVIDLKHPEAKAILEDLARHCDVFIHNFRPQAMKKLGLSYQDIKKVNNKIIYCGSYGYSIQGPYGEKGALDDSIQAASGIAMAMAMNTPDQQPAYLPTVIADKTTGLMVAQSVLAALFYRERHGHGQEIEVPMFETTVSYLMIEHQWGMCFDPPLGEAGYSRILSKNRKPYKTKDGYLAVLPYWDNHWGLFCDIANREDLTTNPKFNTMKARVDNIDETCKHIEDIIKTKTTQDWLDAFKPTNIPHMIVNTFQDLFSDPHLTQSNYWITKQHQSEGSLRFAKPPANFSHTPSQIDKLPPHLGEHTEEILQEIGYPDATIQDLITKKVCKKAKL
ncbi:MAG: CoA transferase [Methylacidiphilales bacterium]|nr:CoA transferase [Candidatus Methylacidiphilales bacterium]